MSCINNFFQASCGHNNLSYYKNTSYSSKDDMFFLKKYNKYSEDYEELSFFYENRDSYNLRYLNKFFGIDAIAGSGSELQRINRLKNWATSTLCFNGKPLPGRIYDGRSCIEILNKAKEDGYALNCRYVSLITNQILLSAGFQSRWAICLPMDLRDTECHCVCEVFSECLNKWIVVDAAFNLFYFDNKGTPLGLIEMRNRFAHGETIKFISQNAWLKQDLLLYWIKNLFRFNFAINNRYNMLCEPITEYACLNPEGFVMENRLVEIDGRTTSYHYYYNDALFLER